MADTTDVLPEGWIFETPVKVGPQEEAFAAVVSHVQSLQLANAKMADRIEALEAALRQIADQPDYRLPKQADIARAALEGK